MTREFEVLAKEFYKMAQKKLGFPTSFLGSDINFVNYESLGLKPNSLACLLLNEVGDPYHKSETWKLEVKEYEVKIIQTLARYFGLNPLEAKGYVTSGGTESNEACLRWSKQYLINQYRDKIVENLAFKKACEQDILQFEQKASVEQRKSVEQKALLSLSIGIELYRKHKTITEILEQMLYPTVFCTEHYTHYSIVKISTHLNLKIKFINALKGAQEGCMDVMHFKEKLQKHIKKFPYNPIIVNVNMGTTQTGAIDDLMTIKSILENTLPKPIYSIHMDGALYGMVMPILKPFTGVEHYFEWIDTLSLSFHKYLGVPQPSGLALTRLNFIQKAFQYENSRIEYPGNILDITVSGSRSGFNILLIYNTLFNGLALHRSTNKLKNMVKHDLKMALLFYKQLTKIISPKHILFIPNQFIIIIPKPSFEIIQKYQLMIVQNRAIITVWHNVNKALIQEFIQDLSQNISISPFPLPFTQNSTLKKELTHVSS